MRVVCIGYRDWALKIYDTLESSLPYEFLIIRSKNQYDESVIQDFQPDLVLFYGWSWVITDNIIENYKCVMLHPSKLPKYRGGSPIQNQIIDGVTNSAVTLFLMNDKLDSGPILKQEEISLLGSLDEIFAKMTAIGIKLTMDILTNGLHGTPQDDTESTYCKRRNPEDSEITIEELQSKSANYLHDKIRMLQRPYPFPYIITADHKKLFFHSTSIGEDVQ